MSGINHEQSTVAETTLRSARAALTRLMEPSDLPGLALIRALGPEAALDLIGSKDASNARPADGATVRWQASDPGRRRVATQL